MPIQQFGWTNNAPPDIDAQNLELDRQQVGEYVDTAIAGVDTAIAGITGAQGEANGLATLDGNGDLELSQVPPSVVNGAALGATSLQEANNLSDLADAGSSRLNIHVAELAICQCVATANVALSGLQTIDGYTTLSGDLVLCVGQSTASQNGPWLAASGAWTRPHEYGSTLSILGGRRASVVNGTVGANSSWLLNTAGTVVVDTTGTTWKLALPSSVVSDARLATPPALESPVSDGAGGWYPLALSYPYVSTDRVLHVSETGSSANSGMSPGQPLKSISTAVSTLNALGGGTVMVAAGTYSENVQLLAHVLVQGAGKLATVIEPATTGPVVSGPGASYFSEGLLRDVSIFGNASDTTCDGLYLPQGIDVASVTVSTVTTTVSVASGGFPGVSPGTNWFVGGTGIAFGTTVSSVSGNSLVLSTLPLASGTVTLSFTNSLSGSNRCVFERILIRNCGRYGVNLEGGRVPQAVHQFNTFRDVECQGNVSDGWNMSGAVEQCFFDHCSGLSNGGNGMTHSHLLDGNGNTYNVSFNTFIRTLLQGSGTGSPNGAVTTTTYGLNTSGTENLYLSPYFEGNGLTDTTRVSCGALMNGSVGVASDNVMIDAHFDSHFVDYYDSAGIGNQLIKPTFSFATGATTGAVASCTLNSTTTVTVASGGFPGASVGSYVQSTGNIAFPTTVVSIVGNTLTLSQAALTTTTATLNFYPDIYEGNLTKPCFIKYGGSSGTPIYDWPKFSGTPGTQPILAAAGGSTPHVQMVGSTGAYGWGALNGNSFTGGAAPTTGAWGVGATIFALSPAVGKPLGWTCVTAGTPGTWQPFALLPGRNAQTLGSNGAVTIDASTGEVQQINLGANATSSSITNPITGQRLTIEWTQDATGSRTYAWPANCKFAGGAAPSASTTATYTDSVTFEYSGTNWLEISRAAAIH